MKGREKTMLGLVRKFFNSRRGNLIENIIYLIIIGALTFTFYTEKFQTPLNENIDALNTKIDQWTSVHE